MSASSTNRTGREAPQSQVRGSGVLAIWHDCATDHLEAYEEWYQSEHQPERLSVPGFLRGRRYEALTSGPQFFNSYDVVEPAVLRSDAYRARLEAPTPATTAMMRHAFQNMSRTICRRATLRNGSSGGCCVAVKVDSTEKGRAIADRLSEPGICRVDLWTAEEGDTALSKEEVLRGGDHKIAACLFIEMTRAEEARALATALGGQAFQLVSEMFACDAGGEP